MFKESVLSSAMESNQKSRVLVLLPEQSTGNLDLARSIYRLASRENADVIYLVALLSLESVLPVTRSMVTMKALTAGNEISVSYKLVVKANWIQTLKKYYRPQDTIIAPRELSGLPGSGKFNVFRSANLFFDSSHSYSFANQIQPTSKRHLC